MNRRHDDEAPILITEAAPSFDEEFAARKKRYSLIMAMRIPCLLLAGVFGIGFNLPIVAVLFIVASVPLPWIAVLIANDRAPLKSRKVNRYKAQPQQVEVADRKIIEAAEVLDARDSRTRADSEPRYVDDPADTTGPDTARQGFDAEEPSADGLRHEPPRAS